MKFIIAFALIAFIAVVSADVSHLSTKGPNGYHYPKPDGPKLDNDYLPPADEVVPEAPTNEYLPAADPPSNDYLPPSNDEAVTTVANEV